ncbi:MAG TPA: hypothetical protein VFN27_16545 [Xanthobacteraceae bacterium]|nr:hypothetical protein [Xanthobacteraceae bacterium]
MIRRALLAFCFLASLAPAFAQAPPAVPALPDNIRLTTYTNVSTTCACAVGFQIYGDNADVDNWIQVYLNGIRTLSTDATHPWSLSSVTGPLSTIPRPITDAVLTFNSALTTTTVVIVGAERPRRLVTFSESQGVTARQLNQAFNTMFAELRENWDTHLNHLPTTFALANANPIEGATAAITDGKATACGDGTCTTWGTTVTAGGGALNLLIWNNGTNWTLIGK